MPKVGNSRGFFRRAILKVYQHNVEIMLTLYYKPTCPFSRRVIAVIERLELEVEKRDILENDAYADELEALGGKRQVPYLMNDETGMGMYESDDIVKYLQDTFGGGTVAAGKPRVHISDATCISCEG
jgi:glutathione S-transferase